MWYNPGHLADQLQERPGFFGDRVLPYVLSEQNPSPTLAIQRAFALSLYLANTGDPEESRKACRVVIEIARKFGYELETYPLWSQIQAFVQDVDETDRQIPTLNAQKELSREMKRWSNDLCRNHPPLDRSTWRDRADPLELLRCASLFLVPSFDAPSASSSDELEALEALNSFLVLTRATTLYAARRADAMRYAIELSAKHGLLSEAFELARYMTHENLFAFPDFRYAFVLYPYLGPVMLHLGSLPITDDAREPLEVIREDMFTEDYRLIAGRIGQSLEETLKKDAGYTLGRMSPARRLKTLERSARLAECGLVLRSGASAGEIAKVEARIECPLPFEYKDFIRIANGWKGGDDGILPPLLPVSSIAYTTLPSPLPITSRQMRRNNPYSRAAKFSNALLLSPSSCTSKIYLVRDTALKLARAPSKSTPTNRTTGDDGQAVPYVKGDYRFVLAREGDDPLYFGTFAGLLNYGIRSFDEEVRTKERLGVERSKTRSLLYTRPLTGENVADEDGDNSQDDGTGQDHTNNL